MAVSHIQSCQPLCIGSNLLRPSRLYFAFMCMINHYTKKCLNNGHFHVYVCLCQGGGREFVSKQHFRVVVPQPIGFCLLQKQANPSVWFIFPCLACHFFVRHFLAKGSFHSSVCSLRWCQSGRLTKTRPLATSRKIQTHLTDDQRGALDKCTCIRSSCTIIFLCMLRLILYRSCWHVWRCWCVFCSLIRTCAVRLKSNYYAWNRISLYFSGRLAYVLNC